MQDGFDLAELERRANGHSIFAPSASAMWLQCPGSLIANLLAKDTAGEDAAIGTVAHAVAEEWLRTGEEPTHLLGETRTIAEGDKTFDVPIDREMLNYVAEYVTWCNETPGDHFTETRVYFSELTPIPKQGGTADHIAASPGHLIITDLKYGTGVQVFAKENPQAQLYAIGAINEHDWAYDFDRVTIRICQPRLRHFDEWETTKADLMRFAAHVKERAALAWQPDAPRSPSPKACRFCRVRVDCPALAELAEELADATFDDMNDSPADRIALREPKKLTTYDLARVYRFRSLFSTWFREIGDELDRRAGDGEDVPGFKLVTGRSSRDWASEEDAAFALDVVPVDTLMPRTLLSPHQAEKALRKMGFRGKEVEAIMAGLCKTTPGRQTLVPEEDIRPGERNVADATFDDL